MKQVFSQRKMKPFLANNCFLVIGNYSVDYNIS